MIYLPEMAAIVPLEIDVSLPSELTPWEAGQHREARMPTGGIQYQIPSPSPRWVNCHPVELAPGWLLFVASSNGRTPDFGSGNHGSSPCASTNKKARSTAGQCQKSWVVNRGHRFQFAPPPLRLISTPPNSTTHMPPDRTLTATGLAQASALERPPSSKDR